MPPSCVLLCGFAIGARDALLWQHYGKAWQSPAVIQEAQRTPHAARTTHTRTHAPAIKSTRLLRVRRYLQRGCSISSILRGCCNALCLVLKLVKIAPCSVLPKTLLRIKSHHNVRPISRYKRKGETRPNRIFQVPTHEPRYVSNA